MITRRSPARWVTYIALMIVSCSALQTVFWGLSLFLKFGSVLLSRTQYFVFFVAFRISLSVSLLFLRG
jgi:hypothetical protein